MNDKYFSKLKNPLTEYKTVYESIVTKDLDNQLDWSVVEDFNLIQIANTHVQNNPVLRAISEKFDLVPIVIKMEKNTIYNWHTDASRGVTLNLLLNNHENSYCLFSDGIKNDNMEDIVELKYEPGYFYVFNTQVRHTVTNLVHDRYLLSCTFRKDKRSLSYQEVLDFCKANDFTY